MNAQAIAALLGDAGPFATSLPGFRPREAQQRMATAVAEAIDRREQLIVEAGTGTGKTYAYLVPALRSGCRVLVSTGTKTLQDQLYLRDLPRVREVLGQPLRTALLKGRANYLCRYRLRRTQMDPRWLARGEALHAVERWAATTERGELAELGRALDDERLSRAISSTADNCLGSRCPDFAECFVVRARRAVQAADVAVVNHHLLLADFSLKQQGFGEVLPGADAIIVDEAHQLPEVASQFLGRRVSTAQLAELIRDTREEARVLEDPAELSEAADALAAALVAVEEASGALGARMTTERAMTAPRFGSATSAVADSLFELTELLEVHSTRSPGLEAGAERAQQLLDTWREVTRPETPAVTSEEDEADAAVRWVEPLNRGCALHATPIRVATGFRKLLSRMPAAWIFASATLDAGDDFLTFKRQLGLFDARTLRLESPFDFPLQTRLHLPVGLPEPNAWDYSERVAERLLPLLRASNGGAFVLCTSYRAMMKIAEALSVLRNPLLVQGDGDKAQLLQQFAAAGDAVLVGTASFWEGVDVRGQALRLVAIDKLPFAVPGDPVQEARLNAIRERGGSPFNEDQLPRAITALRQGVGRLIRDAEDRGLLMLCDPRLQQRGYGAKVLAALPSMPRVDEAGALAWLKHIGGKP